MKFSRCLSVVSLLLLCGTFTGATDYYVSNAGDDSNVGTSTSAPWATVDQINALGVESVVNGTMETWSGDDLTSWAEIENGTSEITDETSVVYADTHSAKFTVDGSGSDLYMYGAALTTTAEKSYVFSFMAKYATANGFCISWQLKDSDTYYYNSLTEDWQEEARFNCDTPSDTAWASYGDSVITRAGTTSLTITLKRDGTVGDRPGAVAYIDSVSLNRGAVLVPGDAVYFESGGTWRELLIPPVSGTAGNEITFGRYGSASNNPLIDGSQLLTNASFSLTAAQTYTYEISFNLASFGNLEPMVWEDGTRLSEQVDVANTESTSGSFYYDSGATTLYIHAIDDSSVITNGSVYEAPLLEECAIDNAKDYIIFEYIDCKKTWGDTANTIGGFGFTGDNNVLRYATISENRRHAVTFYTGAAQGLATGLTLSESESTTLVAFYGSGTITNTLQLSNLTNLDTTLAGQGCVVAHGGAVGSIMDRVNCTITGDGSVIAADLAAPVAFSDCTFTLTNTDNGVFLGTGSTGTTINYTTFYTSGITDYIIYVGEDDFTMNNSVLYGGPSGSWQIKFAGAASTNGTLKNNIFMNGERGIWIVAGAESGFASDYNIFYNLSNRVGHWASTICELLPEWKTVSSGDANSLDSDPLFGNAAAGVFGLRVGSPAIDAGVDVSITSDLTGRAVPNGAAPDIGAHEFYRSKGYLIGAGIL